MKKYIIVDDTTSKRSTMETYVFDSEKEAIEKAEQLISYLTKKEIEETDEFYVGIGEVNEDGEVDFDSIDAIKVYI